MEGIETAWQAEATAPEEEAVRHLTISSMALSQVGSATKSKPDPRGTRGPKRSIMGVPSVPQARPLASEDVYDELWHSSKDFPDFPAGHRYKSEKARNLLSKTMTCDLRGRSNAQVWFSRTGLSKPFERRIHRADYTVCFNAYVTLTHTHTHTYIEKYRETGRQTDRQTQTETKTQTDGRPGRETDRQRQRERNRDKQTERESKSKTGSEHETYIHSQSQGQRERERERERER